MCSLDDIQQFVAHEISPHRTLIRHLVYYRIPPNTISGVPGNLYLLKSRTTVREIQMILAAGDCAVKIRMVLTRTNKVLNPQATAPDGFLMDVKMPLDSAFLRSLESHELRELVDQIIHLLLKLHAPPYEIVHGDLKPDNIVYCSSKRQPLFIDFEMAQYIHSSTFDDTQQSTPKYRSPRRVSMGYNVDNPVRKEDDYYALAWTVYEIMTGKGPFPDKSDSEALEAIRKGEQPDLSQISESQLRETLDYYLKKGNRWT